MTLHEFEVGAHGLLVEGASGVRIPLVAVDTAEDDLVSVDGDDVPVDGDGAESDPQGDGLGARRDGGVVEHGGLSGPGLRVGDGHLGVAGGGDAEFRDGDGGAVGSVNGDLGGAVLPGCVDEEVVDAVLRACQQRDLAEDPRHPPHVLVLQEGAVGPLTDGYCQHIAAGAQLRSDVELTGEARTLGPPQFDSVEPDAGEGVDSLETQQHPVSIGERLTDLEGVAVAPGRVLIGNDDVFAGSRDRNRVVDVEIGGAPERCFACRVGHLPHRGNGEVDEVGVVESRVEETFRYVKGGVDELETPRSRQVEGRGIGVQVSPWGHRPLPRDEVRQGGVDPRSGVGIGNHGHHHRT